MVYNSTIVIDYGILTKKSRRFSKALKGEEGLRAAALVPWTNALGRGGLGSLLALNDVKLHAKVRDRIVDGSDRAAVNCLRWCSAFPRSRILRLVGVGAHVCERGARCSAFGRELVRFLMTSWSCRTTCVENNMSRMLTNNL